MDPRISSQRPSTEGLWHPFPSDPGFGAPNRCFLKPQPLLLHTQDWRPQAPPPSPYPAIVQLHVQVPVADTAPGVVPGAQVVAQPRVPQAAHGESLGPLLPSGPETKHGLQGVALAELHNQARVERERERGGCRNRGFSYLILPSLPGRGNDSLFSQMKKLRLQE